MDFTVPPALAVDIGGFITAAPRSKRAPTESTQSAELKRAKPCRTSNQGFAIHSHTTPDDGHLYTQMGSVQKRADAPDDGQSQSTLDWLDETCTALQRAHMILPDTDSCPLFPDPASKSSAASTPTSGSADLQEEGSDLLVVSNSSESSDLHLSLPDDASASQDLTTQASLLTQAFAAPRRATPFPWEADAVVQESFRYMRSAAGASLVTAAPSALCALPPTGRPTLVLDLDETLVHSKLDESSDTDFHFVVDFNDEQHDVHVSVRPGVHAFLQFAAAHFDLVVFTASLQVYAETVLDFLDPESRLFSHRLYRDACVVVDNGLFVKDLSLLERDLATTVILDNSPAVFSLQVENGFLISSWYGDACDTELLELLPVLTAMADAPDMRPLLRDYLQLEHRIACA